VISDELQRALAVARFERVDERDVQIVPPGHARRDGLSGHGPHLEGMGLDQFEEADISRPQHGLGAEVCDAFV
jgi:hypothetical protein